MNKQSFWFTLSSFLVASMTLFSTQAAAVPGYVYSSDGKPVRSSDGTCVRTSEWRKELANKECNPELLPQEKVATTAPTPAPSLKGITFPEAALFDLNKSELTPEGKQKIRDYREQAKTELSSAVSVKIIGYSDSTGSAEYNKQLSLKRAEAVRNYLAELGGDTSKMEVVGMGEDQPIADNSTAEGRAQNRRIVVEVIGHGKGSAAGGVSQPNQEPVNVK